MDRSETTHFACANKDPIPLDDEASNIDDDFEDEEYDIDDEHNYVSSFDIPRTLPNTNLYAAQNQYFIRDEKLNSKGWNSLSKKNSILNRSSTRNSYEQSICLNKTDTDSGSKYNQKSNKYSLSGFSDSNINILYEKSNRKSRIEDTRRLVTSPPVDTQDRLRDELEAISDIKKAAARSNIYNGFPTGLESNLVTLRDTHTKLLQLLRERTARIEEQKRHEINANALANIPSGGTTTFAQDDNISNNIARTGTEPANNLGLIKSKSPGPVVNPEETKYVQKLVDAVRSIR